MSADDKKLRAELVDHFHSAVEDHEDVMAECLAMLRLYNLTPADLFFKYEAFLMSRPSGLRAKMSVLTLPVARQLRTEVAREQQAQAVSSSTSAMSGVAVPRGGEVKGSVGVKRGRNGHGDLGGLLSSLSGVASPSPSAARNGSPMLPKSAQFDTSFATPSRPTNGGPSGPSASQYRPSLNTSASSLQTPLARSNIASPLSSPVSADEASPGGDGPQSFRNRHQPHSLVETLNPHLPASVPNRPSGRPRTILRTLEDPQDWNYRYMFEKVSQRSEALDEQIDTFGDNIRADYGLEELGDPHFVSDEAIYTVGRILAPPTDTTKASASSLFLESSRLLGSGKRIALRFPPGEVIMKGGPPGVKTFGVFPGCLVCVKGKNGGGGFFAVEEVVVAQPSYMNRTDKKDLLKFQHGDKTRGEPVNLTVAAGPFSLDDDLSYEPLQALLDVAERERPDVLILLGPFVDAHHPMIVSGSITRSVTDIFRSEISTRLERLSLASPATRIILVPSIRDIISQHVALPQAALDKEAFGLPPRVSCLPNPCTLEINEISIAITTADILFHLRSQEVTQRVEEADPQPPSASPVTKDAMASLVRHVLGQRSFYPLFPVPENMAGEVNLDVTHQKLLRLDDTAPDLLILPSKLKHFSKVVDSTLVVNPAFLSRARTAGTFAKISVHAMDRDMLEAPAEDGEEQLEHGVFERARAEIWKI
ncbi:DNA polymerase alpha subunit B N-terminal-domain-containing protein [Dioszegia hungarica]|uniref:DNA polymerase alpha subunit B n=1 Tax=Dioszegia hungarica TaxID=4972 RepID=A0AA38H9R4_9TREE|nr:DNA polymerase alpha subunit B N-terminal-domain-containing protein [Dioszegia hungarica]KAI9635169.1 DNA polymerase alpha subunit B N-terminal-domain-containing protein [Dioszegia hungarica]